MIALTSKENPDIPENALLFIHINPGNHVAGFIASYKTAIYSNHIKLDYEFKEGADVLADENVKEVIIMLIRNVKLTLDKAQS